MTPSPGIALLLLDGLPRQPSFRQFGHVCDELEAFNLPIYRFSLPADPPPAELLARGDLARHVVPAFDAWYQERVQKLGPGSYLILGAYSAGGLTHYAWAAQSDWGERDRVVFAFTLAAPHRCEKGFIQIEREDGRASRLQLAVNEPAVPVEAVAQRLAAKLEVFFGDGDLTVLESDARFPGRLADVHSIGQHRPPGARHLTIGADPTVREVVRVRLEAYLARAAS